MPPRKSKGKKATAAPKGRKTRASEAAAQEAPELPADAPSEQPPSQRPQEALPPTVSDNDNAESANNIIEDATTLDAREDPPPRNESIPVDEPESSSLPSPPVEPVEAIPDVEMGANSAVTAVSSPTPAPSMTVEQRQAKLEALRSRMVCWMSANLL